jgi:hypothetical protein
VSKRTSGGYEFGKLIGKKRIRLGKTGYESGN